MSDFVRPTDQNALESNFAPIKPLMNPTMAQYESSRCLFCYDAPCVNACPTSIDIPLFIRQINNGNVKGAAKTIYASNFMGNTCGKVCPTEVLCEGACVLNHQELPPIEIGRLQNYATDLALKSDLNLKKQNGFYKDKVAIIGAGPSGIACASVLASAGVEVDIFEAKEQPSGLALHGVAPYKITNLEILEEVNYLQKQLGFKLYYNQPISSKQEVEALENKYGAIFLGIGLGYTRLLRLEHSPLNKNIIGATEFIEQFKLNPLSVEVAKHVVVIGGGNTAMDVASACARMGATDVKLVYRRSNEEKSAYDFEYQLAKSVGVKGVFNAQPVALLGKKEIKAIHCIKTETIDGRLVNIPNSEFEIPCDMVINATGQEKLKTFLTNIGIETDADGRIIVNEKGQTSNAMFYAGGDAVNGGAEVVNAVDEGQKAAKHILRNIS